MKIKSNRISDDINLFHLPVVVLLAALLLAATTVSASPAPVLNSDSEISTTGFFQLSWQSDAEQVQLQEAQDEGFSSPVDTYLGTDKASLISGKKDGQWFYRARNILDTEPGPWSNTVEVTVKHHDLMRAFMFFSLGLVIFVSLTLLVILGSRKANEQD